MKIYFLKNCFFCWIKNKKLFPIIEDFWVCYQNLVSTFEEALLIFETRPSIPLPF